MGATAAFAGQPLRLMANELRQQRWIQTIQVIETAKVPIIKLTSVSENLSTDIAINDEYTATTYCSSEGLAQHSGIAASELIKSYIRKLPALAPIVLILKQYLYERGLNNTFSGGISSYLLTLMAISFLQIQGGNSSEAGLYHPKRNLGTLLQEFLEYYGRRFDFESTGISISNGGSHFPLVGYCFPLAPVVIVDPFNPVCNIAQSAFGIARVKAAFAEGYGLITSGLESNKTHAILSRLIQQEKKKESNNRTTEPKPVKVNYNRRINNLPSAPLIRYQ